MLVKNLLKIRKKMWYPLRFVQNSTRWKLIQKTARIFLRKLPGIGIFQIHIRLISKSVSY